MQLKVTAYRVRKAWFWQIRISDDVESLLLDSRALWPRIHHGCETGAIATGRQFVKDMKERA